jgi:hypothetical protein
LSHQCSRGSGPVAVATAEAHVADPVRLTELLVRAVGSALAAAALGLPPPGPEEDVLDLVVCVSGVAAPGRLELLRLAAACVAAVESAVGDGAAAMWLRLPDPGLGWEPPGAVMADADGHPGLPRAVTASAVAFIEEATYCTRDD